MPGGIIATLRSIYEQQYEPQTRRPLPGVRIAIPCFSGTLGYPGSYVIVNFGGQRHPKILAANCVKPDKFDVYHGSIQLNPDLLKERPEFVKMVLAEEWLEVMMGLRDKEHGKMQKLVDDKLDLIVLFNALRRRGLWQDSTEQSITMHGALRQLLVPEDALRKVADECHLTLEGIHRQIKANPDQARTDIDKFVKTYAGKHDVTIELVYDRLMAVLGL